MNMICKKIKVIGQVQGVFYRAFTQKIAQDLKLTGWVRNEQDGSVLVVACGDEASLNKLIQLLHQGPPAANVTEVRVETIGTETFTDFNIIR
ncbi:MAG: acylphosphatase [Gammaproteobacteria bacterium]|jgi:acylphosphatase